MTISENFSFERREGKSPDVHIFQLTGPLTLRTLFTLQPELRKGAVPATTILDMTAVPYLDSAGMGVVVNHYVHCTNNNAKFLVAGVSSRVLELFKITKVNTLIPMFGTIEEAEAQA